jgi:hypothetical protein
MMQFSDLLQLRNGLPPPNIYYQSDYRFALKHSTPMHERSKVLFKRVADYEVINISGFPVHINAACEQQQDGCLFFK